MIWMEGRVKICSYASHPRRRSFERVKNSWTSAWKALVILAFRLSTIANKQTVAWKRRKGLKRLEPVLRFWHKISVKVETFMQNKLKMGNKLIIALTEVKKWAFCVFVQLDPCKECRLFLIWKKKIRQEACEPTWSHFHCFCFRLFIYKKIYCIRLSRQISRLNSPNQPALTILEDACQSIIDLMLYC